MTENQAAALTFFGPLLIWLLLVGISYGRLGIMRNHRIVETRPGVYTVETWTQNLWFIPFWYGWVADRWDFGVYEYTLDKAEKAVEARREREREEYLRKHPPEGYPKVAKTWTVT